MHVLPFLGFSGSRYKTVHTLNWGQDLKEEDKWKLGGDSADKLFLILLDFPYAQTYKNNLRKEAKYFVVVLSLVQKYIKYTELLR